MAFDNLLIEHDARVAVITINRPKVLNALNAATIDELQRALVDLKRDTGTRVVIITGAGEKAFVAGADINELAAQTPTSGRDLALAGQHVFDLADAPSSWDPVTLFSEFWRNEAFHGGGQRLEVQVLPGTEVSTYSLSFEEPDVERFPCLALARQALLEGGCAPVVLNAANEVAVAAFLEGKIRFTQIPELIAEALAKVPARALDSIDTCVDVDTRTRATVRDWLPGGVAAVGR